MSRVTRMATGLMLVLILGLHWPVLQSLAWISMLARFSAEVPLKEAVVKTFDGKHPCQLCITIETGKQAEKKSKQQRSVTRLDLCLDLPAAITLLPPVFDRHRPADTWAEPRHLRPPVPPPRAA